MTRAAAKTGVGPTFMVAVEQAFEPERRMIEDELALGILPPTARVLARLCLRPRLRDWMVRATERSAPGIWAGMMCRKRYIDDRLMAAAGSMQAVVNLGAGFDTRLYRLPGLDALRAWEIDQAENMTPKLAGLQRVFGRVPSQVKTVTADFDHESLETALTRAGFSRELVTFYIQEAVSQYLTEQAFEATLAFLAGAAAKSELVFTYVRKDFIDGRERYGQHTLYEKYVVKERAWRVGLEPESVGELLARHGWELVEDLGYEDLAERYVKPTGRDLPTMRIERIAHARKR